MAESDRGKLVTLLNYLIDHNREHSQELRELAEGLEGTGGSVAGHISEAAGLMDRSTEALARALSELQQG